MSGASTGPHQFTMPGWITPAPFEKLLNMNIVDAGAGEATLTMPFLVDYANGAGIMHGGALVSLADTAVVMAIKSIIEPGSHFATTHLETNFLYPVKKGVITARGKVLSKVDRVIEAQAVIYDEDEKPVMEYSCTFKIARDAKLRGITFADTGAPDEKEG